MVTAPPDCVELPCSDRATMPLDADAVIRKEKKRTNNRDTTSKGGSFFAFKFVIPLVKRSIRPTRKDLSFIT